MKTLLALWMLCLAGARAENPAYQFLVLVDGSQSMASRETAAARKVRELVRTGFQNQAMAGDFLDVWTFTSELKTNRFPTRILNGTNHLAPAELAGRLIEGEKFVGRTRFKNFAGELNAWIARQPNALLLIVTDGEDAIVGLPNDLEINSYISPRKGQARTARRVFLAGLLVQDGRVREWMAHDGLGPVQLPRLPAREPVPPAVMAATTESAAEPAKPAPEPLPPPVIDLPPGAVILTPEPAVKPAEQPPRQVPEAPVAVEAPPTAEPPPAAKVEAAPARAEAPAQTDPIAAAPSTTTTVPEKAVAGPSKRADDLKAGVAGPTNEAVTPAAPVAVTAPGSNRNLYYLFGAGVAVLLAALLLLRRPAGEKASLISKSLSQK